MTRQTDPSHSVSADLEAEVLVVGGGLAGLCAGLLLARAGFDTLLVDAASPEPTAIAALDGRTTALMTGALKILEACGVWPALAEEAGALWAMRLCEDGPGGMREILFDARELSGGAGQPPADAQPFGYNIANARLRQALLARAAEAPGLRLVAPARIAGLSFAGDAAEALLEDGRRLRAPLIVGADGRGSPCRTAARIHARKTMTGQVALAGSFRHGRAHDSISTEFHRDHGPLVLVPLPGKQSSFVWVEEAAEAERLMALPKAGFAEALEEASHGLLGRVGTLGKRFAYPVGILHAERMVAPRLALVGEAVHALPPIGAQGLNLSLADVAVLVEALVDARRAGQDRSGRDSFGRASFDRDWAGADTLLAYERARQRDVQARVLAISALNRSVAQPGGALRALRGLGLGLVDRVGPLKRALMQQGMRPLGPLPRLMRGEPL